MWTAQVLMESREVRNLEVAAIEGRHVPLEALIQQARQLADSYGVAPPWYLLEAAVSSGPSPWNDPIPLWINGLSEAPGEGVSIGRTPESRDELAIVWEEQGVQVWHHPTVVVLAIPEGAEQLSIVYEWERGDVLPHFYTPEEPVPGELWPALDARLFTGQASSILELDEPPDQVNVPPEMLHDRQPRFRWLLGVKRRAGILIGRIARRFVRQPPKLVRDPGFLSRLRAEEMKAPSVAKDCPRIQTRPPLQNDKALIVMVHGTFSCSIDATAYIHAARPDVPTVRFEHDTFVPVSENARELAQELVRVCSGTTAKVLLIAHSRGGLVACQAAALVSQHLRSPDVSVWTAGTPHWGTPLAGVSGFAARSMGALYRLCARVDHNGMDVTLVEGAVSYLVAAGELPAGVSCMRLGSDFLELHRLHSQFLRLKTIGGRCDARLASSGHGVLVGPAVEEFFNREDNDLVVPTSSAILDGSQPLESCSHSQYFQRCDLPTLLQRHFNVP